jgi:hypothetical protein
MKNGPTSTCMITSINMFTPFITSLFDYAYRGAPRCRSIIEYRQVSLPTRHAYDRQENFRFYTGAGGLAVQSVCQSDARFRSVDHSVCFGWSVSRSIWQLKYGLGKFWPSNKNAYPFSEYDVHAKIMSVSYAQFQTLWAILNNRYLEKWYWHENYF